MLRMAGHRVAAHPGSTPGPAMAAKREADVMIDIHLINLALAGLGISAGAAILIAGAVIAVAAVMGRKPTSRQRQTPGSATPGQATPAQRELALH